MEKLFVLTNEEKKYCDKIQNPSKMPESLLEKAWQAHKKMYENLDIGGGSVKPFEPWKKKIKEGFIFCVERKNELVGYVASTRYIEAHGFGWTKVIGFAGLKKGLGTTLINGFSSYLSARNINVICEINYARGDLRRIFGKCGYKIIDDQNLVPLLFLKIFKKKVELQWTNKDHAIYRRRSGILGLLPPKILIIKFGKSFFWGNHHDYLRKILK